ncbi:hypothetical protein P1P91_05900 [Halomonas piscis]|uniref:MvaT DNA-binding domain-containing protein n=1 Tax=Halomonas piscis TaxID=3031727 RepID=A0ABY9Z2G2_9GAMM|nr:hypothetical protein [Halomonas piscis]WNK21206.1 hypothetical protein P1P91_05900 [Halomonas piscis]
MPNPIKRHENLVQEQERIQKERKDLENSDSYQNAIAFKEAIEKVMKQHGKTETDLLELYGDSDAKKTSKSPKKAKKSLPLKHYRNPHTEEVVEARSFKNTMLKEWAKKYGRETVEGWEFDPKTEKKPAQASDDTTEPSKPDKKS